MNALLDNAAPVETSVGLTLIGGPTALIEIDGFRLLTDPTFDPPGLFQKQPIHMEKTEGPAIAIDDIGPVDAVLLSHDQHLDNLDRSGRGLLAKATATFTTVDGAQRLGGNARGLQPFETVEFANQSGDKLFVTGAPARHGPAGIEPISGEVIGLLIGREQPGDAIYVTGDTVWYDGIAEIARRYSPKLVIVFTGSAKPRGPFRMTMDSNDAIETAHAFPEAKIVAVHNRGWAHFKESQADLAFSFDTLGIGARLISLEPGKRVELALPF